jgi:hypothetical protein
MHYLAGKSKDSPENSKAHDNNKIDKINALTGNSDWVISISPDGENIITFNISKLQL